ncbi:hypothetical protein [Paractinoplanes lichenicola]|uniref:Uncharacterized protein n=1 Tax=Paractinoplanes lichenicola TaxID=2802976 RepID=A0ABS1W3N8_9ACTN|nr:hypothetical protein [Actinoplanes lichenicola]MBL7261347.1 hypothetical protein [Actinoplanes lichenicola]
MTPVPPGRPRAARPARVTLNNRLLNACDGPQGSTPLHEEVDRNLQHLWSYGNNRDGKTPGRRPDWILIRPPFLMQQPDLEDSPTLPRLVPARGLTLRLQLLMLFDAQCRFGPNEPVQLNRTFEDVETNAPIRSWQKVVLADTTSDYRDATALRGRQIKDALRTLYKEHLVSIGPDKKRPNRRDLDRITLLSEASTPVTRPRYTVPTTGVYVSRHFFTSSWVFALTNTEIATFLALSSRRAYYPGPHSASGVFVLQKHRGQFGLKDNTWRSARNLHFYGLVNRAGDPHRDTLNGRITDFGARWKKHQVMPTHFTIVDATLEQPAVPTINRVLNHPSLGDQFRMWLG